MIAVDPGANLTVSEDEVRQCRPAIAAADILLTQLENNLPAIEQVIAIAREAQTFIILNPAPFQPVPDSLLAQVDMLTPNATECTLLTGVPVRMWLRRASGAGAACQRHSLTDRDLGHAGGVVLGRGNSELIPAFPAQPKDTTGAGDAFNGAWRRSWRIRCR